eukprot:4326244-Amphidinium_carterae.1
MPEPLAGEDQPVEPRCASKPVGPKPGGVDLRTHAAWVDQNPEARDQGNPETCTAKHPCHQHAAPTSGAEPLCPWLPWPSHSCPYPTATSHQPPHQHCDCPASEASQGRRQAEPACALEP